MASKVKSFELYERAEKVMPGAQSNLRVPLIAKPLFFAKGKGARLWDVDGKEYIDFLNGAGPGILGHSNEEYLQALKDQMDTLYCLGSGVGQTEMDVEVAEKFVQHVPCAEKVRFSVAGTEAVQLAIRLARAYTKRPYFIRFEGHYHGWLDNVLGGIVREGAPGKPFAGESDEDHLGTEGRDPKAFEGSFLLPWNDSEVLEEVLEKYWEEIAMIHMEPILCNGGCCPPRPGYLERVRDLCTKYGIVLSFDEIITGFRIALNGAQGMLGITPDIATFGKAMAGGIPMSAVAGKKEIMDLLFERKVIGAGTFNGYPLGVAASLATLRILEKDNGAHYNKIEKYQKRLTDGLREISGRRGLPLLIQGPRGVFFTLFVEKKVAYSVRDLGGVDWEKQDRFYNILVEEGVLLMFGGRWYLSGGLTDADIDKALECTDRAMARL